MPMSEAAGSTQNRVMANGDGGGGAARAPRPTPRSAHRRLLALGVSFVATAAVTVPLAYQAHESRSVATPTTVARPQPPPSVLPTTTINTVPALRWARSAGGSQPEPLDGATLDDVVVVSVDAEDAVRVEFWIDPGTTSTPPDWVDDRPPFTLSVEASATVGTYDTHRLSNGDHSIEVLVVRSDGDKVRMVSRFRVANG